MTPVDSAEDGRLAALRRYDADDVPPEQELLGLVRVAATVAGVPTATLNLLDATVQRNYATHGFAGGECDREDSLCVVALRSRSALHVPDASRDPRFATSPWVDGSLDSIRLYASSPLVTPDGWMIGTLCVFDSRPGELSAQARQALDDLAAQAMALLERRRLTRVAQQALRDRSHFLAAVSHEIRTPMNGVLGMLDLVLAEELPQEARRCAEVAHRSADALLALVDDVLDLAQGEAGRTRLSPRPFDPSALLADVGDALRVLAERKGLRLVARCAPGLPWVLGDPDRVRQVLVNLVGNAVKFSAEGDVEVALEGAVFAGAARLRFTVRDSGEGIAAEELPLLFTPFAQGRSGQRHGGTGLGLSICAQLAEAMGGSIDVSSVLGAGSTFVLALDLPVAEAPAAPTASASAPGALRVLVADDSDVNRIVAAGLLEAMGAEVVTVEDGVMALREAATGAYDLVLLDHEMPGLSGPSAAREIRALAGRACRVPLYALTGRLGPDDQRACVEAGMDGVLAKPLDPALLAAALEEAPRR